VRIRVRFEQTIERFAEIEVDEQEYEFWSGGMIGSLRQFLEADRHQDVLERDLVTAAVLQGTDTIHREFKIIGADRA